MSPHETLGVGPNATKDEIDKAFRELTKQWHPDRNKSDGAEEKFKEISNAYDALRSGRAPRPRVEQPTYQTLFEEVFSSPGFQRGQSVQAQVEISFLESYAGCTREVQAVRRRRCPRCQGHGYKAVAACTTCGGTGYRTAQDAPFQIRMGCPVCRGTGQFVSSKCEDCAGAGLLPPEVRNLKVSVPRGIASGMQIRIREEGDECRRAAGRPGDLVVVVIVNDHEIYRRQGLDLLADIPVGYATLVTGGTVELPDLTGKTVSVTVPTGTQSGTRFRLRGRGLGDPAGNFGDMIVTVKVETPKAPTPEYLEAVGKLVAEEAGWPGVRAWREKAARHSK